MLASKPSTWRRWLQIVGTLLSSGLFIWLLIRQDWQKTWVNLSRLPVWVWLLCFALVVAGMGFNSLRWYVLLRSQKVQISFWKTVQLVFTGAFASNFLPSTVGGDTVRVLGLMRLVTDKALCVASVVVDRLMNVTAMLTILPFALFTFGSLEEIFRKVSSVAPAMAGAVVWAKGKHWIIKIKDKLVELFGVWLRQPGVLVWAFVISWASVFVIYVSTWLQAVNLGIPVRLYQVMGVSAITYLITLLPISFNGYGLREVLVTTLYMQLGASLEQAATLAFTTRFFMLFESLAGAFWLGDVLSEKKQV
jgi:glycosyltransferase 2 family protein